MVYVVDALDLRVARERHLIKTHGAHLLECGLERAQTFERGLWFDELVFGQDDLSDEIFHWHHRA